MCFAGHCGVELQLQGLAEDSSFISSLFAEELGVVIQVNDEQLEVVTALALEHHLKSCFHVIGKLNQSDSIRISIGEKQFFSSGRVELQRTWSETTYHMQSMRDNSDCAKEEFDQI